MTDTSEQSAITRSQIKTLKGLIVVILALIAAVASAVYGVTSVQIAQVRQECVERVDDLKVAVERESVRNDQLIRRLLDCEGALLVCRARPEERGWLYTPDAEWWLVSDTPAWGAE